MAIATAQAVSEIVPFILIHYSMHYRQYSQPNQGMKTSAPEVLSIPSCSKTQGFIRRYAQNTWVFSIS